MHNRSRAQAFRGRIADEVLDNFEPLELKWAEYFDAPDGRVFLAEVDGEAVGMAYGVPGERTELCNLYLLEEAAGNGISEQLLDAVVRPGEPAFCGSRSSTSAPRCSTPSRASPSTARKRTTRATASP